jgi:lipopolysaccharide transport system permease protein
MKALPTEALALWRARALCVTLTRREVAARYAGTALGLVWAYAQPLLTIAAYYLVFDVVFAMRLGEGAATRAVGTYLIAGMLPWMAFSDAVARAMNSLLESANVLQKNPLPPMLFPVRAVLASSVVFAPLLLLLVLALLVGWMQWGDALWWRQSQGAPLLQQALHGLQPVMSQASQAMGRPAW